MENSEMLVAISDMLKEQFATMDQRFDAMDHDFNILKDRTKRIEITLENSVLPRLQNIENCYVSTYQRYADSATKIDTMEADIDVIKTIVAEHISKLQKIS